MVDIHSFEWPITMFRISFVILVEENSNVKQIAWLTSNSFIWKNRYSQNADCSSTLKYISLCYVLITNLSCVLQGFCDV